MTEKVFKIAIAAIYEAYKLGELSDEETARAVSALYTLKEENKQCNCSFKDMCKC